MNKTSVRGNGVLPFLKSVVSFMENVLYFRKLYYHKIGFFSRLVKRQDGGTMDSCLWKKEWILKSGL